MKTVKISDEKALCLSAVSAAVKRFAGVSSHECPEWTAAFERTLARLNKDELNHLEFLLEALRGGKAAGDLPK